MSEVLRERIFTCCILAAVFVAALTLSGCSTPNPRSGATKDEWALWGDKQKRPGAPALFFGLSDQAQQVERNLGVD